MINGEGFVLILLPREQKSSAFVGSFIGLKSKPQDLNIPQMLSKERGEP